jgi:hypothetical protein
MRQSKPIPGTKGGKIIDLDAYLTHQTGLNAQERVLWKADIEKLMRKASESRDRQDMGEANNVMMSGRYWKEHYVTNKTK